MASKKDAPAHYGLNVELNLVLGLAPFYTVFHCNGLEPFTDYCESFVIVVHVGLDNVSLLAFVEIQFHVLKVQSRFVCVVWGLRGVLIKPQFDQALFDFSLFGGLLFISFFVY